ncbi:hypothetical protein [Pseudomonas sp. REP124]|nr:hypothetical protein [Pseudomonas sp. REP124]
MSITKIIKGPHRFAGLWWVIAECNGKIQHISPGQDSVTIH